MTQGHNVRLTTQAHRLCVEETKKTGTNMKTVASEAIYLLSKNEDKDDLHRTISNLKRKLEADRWNGLFMLTLGMIGAGCLGIFIGMIL